MSVYTYTSNGRTGGTAMADIPGFDNSDTTRINQSSPYMDQVPIFNNYSPAASKCTPAYGIPLPTFERPVTSTFQPVTSTLSVSGSIPFVSDESKAVYHSMTSPPLMSWPISHSLDSTTARRLMTPLHVITALQDDRFPLYPQGASTAGGGLLKIATEVQPATSADSTSPAVKTPPTPAEVQQAKYATEYGHECHVSLMQNIQGIAQRSACWPTQAVALIASGESNELKRPASGEPAPNANWPQLKRRKLRTTFTKVQVDVMELSFQASMYLAVTTRKQLAQQLRLEDTQVKTWFQNRRMRYKRQHPDEYITPVRNPASRQTLPQVAKTLHCPPVALQNQFIVPAPPPSVSTPSAAVVTNSCEQLQTYPRPMLLPSTVYNFGAAPSAIVQENCCPAQAVYGAPVFPHYPAGLDMHHWISTNVIGPYGGAQIPPRHI